MLVPLVVRMTAHDPLDRPSAAEALQHFNDLMQSVWTLHRLWRPYPREESVIVRPTADAIHWVCCDGLSLARNVFITVSSQRSFLWCTGPSSDDVLYVLLAVTSCRIALSSYFVLYGNSAS